ncbi:MAG TPA: hypothetical protein PLL85_06950, partial [Gemmiger qucibialis]|nr:hypothetical protein [Gemmiger qucibialis]
MLTETGLWLQLSLSAFMSALFLRSFQVAQGFGVMVFDAPAAGLAPAEGEAIHQHSIKRRPVWEPGKRKTAKDIEWLSRREYNPFLWKAWMLMGR